jgi:hypothetical protein
MELAKHFGGFPAPFLLHGYLKCSGHHSFQLQGHRDDVSSSLELPIPIYHANAYENTLDA